MLSRIIKSCIGHVDRNRYLAAVMSANLLFHTSGSGSKKSALRTLPRMNCSVPVDDFPIPGFRKRQFTLRVCFAMIIN